MSEESKEVRLGPISKEGRRAAIKVFERFTSGGASPDGIENSDKYDNWQDELLIRVGELAAAFTDAIEDAARDARTRAAALNLPKHINLSIEHQPHAVNYESVAEWIAEAGCDCVDAEEMIRTGEVWQVHWHPRTPVVSCCVAASTLEKALERANELELGEAR